ncbi:outer membrane protein assembly factor BamE [Bacillus salipaludis]|uniref:Outer membrane protein assembly factor BamE n=1 Tax=Bacillus salipaludis TaxID=2547811 RepID=A0A4R5VSN6_9BACI|nr:outer membrane protein assembly factor BamE [Bacillus salipaludis]TDK61804.1 outer membrane protein assembly factor BamE [Bacillus salipaludis]
MSERKLRYKKNLLWGTFCLIGILYVLLFIGYQFLINLYHSSLSLISISAILLPFAFLILFQWVLWTHNYFRNKGKGKVKSAFVVITTLGVIPPLFCLVKLGLNEYKYNFTVENWIKSPTERVYIVDDLLNDYELIGMTKDQVNTLLGKPTTADYFKDDNNIVYYLGNERGLISIDSEWLVIWFNSSGKVVKYKVLKD